MKRTTGSNSINISLELRNSWFYRECGRMAVGIASESSILHYSTYSRKFHESEYCPPKDKLVATERVWVGK